MRVVPPAKQAAEALDQSLIIALLCNPGPAQAGPIAVSSPEHIDFGLGRGRASGLSVSRASA
jgi:hypothetical protein